MKRGDKRTEAILDAAEGMARVRGYNGFSFRDLAQMVGIKSASVHYHFPSKADLGAALARRYTDRFLAALDSPVAVSPGGEAAATLALKRYIAAYRAALMVDDKMCLCGMFGAEIGALPETVVLETRRFFERNVAWLTASFGGGNAARREALKTISALEGALILARSLGDKRVFDEVAEALNSPPASEVGR
jgi:TetR/AcrR family transcriptional repressor of nem operon